MCACLFLYAYIYRCVYVVAPIFFQSNKPPNHTNQQAADPASLLEEGQEQQQGQLGPQGLMRALAGRLGGVEAALRWVHYIYIYVYMCIYIYIFTFHKHTIMLL